MKKLSFIIVLSALHVSAAWAQVHTPEGPADTLCLDDELHVKLSEVVVTGVTGQSLLRESPLPFAVVSPKELASTSYSNIIDAIAHMPGIAQITTGAGISKPVIRGLGYNRVAVVSDGIRQEGQQWGDEHGIEIDAADVGSVEILKGPASLMYGSDALAGVAVFRPHALLPVGTAGGSVQTEYQSNNGLLAYSLNAAGNVARHPEAAGGAGGSTVWDVRYSEKLARAYYNKVDKRVPGSQFHERSASGLLGLNRPWGHSHAKFTYYHLTPSIVTGERDADTGRLLPADGEAPHSPTGYHKALPFQQVHHYKAVWDNSLNLGEARLNALLGYQQNRRQEFEEADEPELDFRLHTLNYDLRLLSAEQRAWRLASGINGMWQRSENRADEALIPPYQLFDIGVFATATRTWPRWNLSGGVRYDHRHLHAQAQADRFADIERDMGGLTGSLGATYCLNRNTHLRLNLARGFRAPNLSELGSNGVHEGSLRYETGRAQLKPEHSWQLDMGADYSSHFLTAQVSLFANHIGHFIFLQRLLAADEERLHALWPESQPYRCYGYTAGTARLWGGEATVVVHPVRRLHVENSFSYVSTRLLHQDADARYLPFTPQPRWTLALRCDLLRQCRHVAGSYVSLSAETYLRQHHVHRANDTETPTPSYSLLGASAGTDVLWRGRRLCTLTLTAANLLDRAYQNHLSRLKYADVNPLTGRRGVSGMGRNIGLKVAVPFDL